MITKDTCLSATGEQKNKTIILISDARRMLNKDTEDRAAETEQEDVALIREAEDFAKSNSEEDVLNEISFDDISAEDETTEGNSGEYREPSEVLASVDSYLQQISQIPLLTPEEEHALAVRIVNGDMEARNQMVQSNLRLVPGVARRYIGLGLPLSDLIEEGNVGLIKAANLFDPDRGCKFVTYAYFWILQAIRRAVSDKARAIRLPVHMTDTLFRINRVKRNLLEKLQRDPKEEEIAEACGMTIEKYREIVRITGDVLYLEETIKSPKDEEDSGSFMDFIADTTTPTPEDVAENEDLKRKINEALKTLRPHEKEVIIYRFGLDGLGKRKLGDIAALYNVSRERIRQIELSAIKKLRRPSVSKKLMDFV